MTTIGDLITDPAIGLDVARFQPANIDWPACAALGVRTVTVKWWHGPWRGDASTQAFAAQQYREAKEAGLLVGRYAWWLPERSMVDQTAAWCAVSDDSDLPLTIDAEEPSAPKGAQTREHLEWIVERVEALTGRKPIIYSGAWWADDYLGHDSATLAACPYWHAAYPRKLATGTDYAGALREWLAQAAPTLPRIWRDVAPIAYQLDGTDDASKTGALRLPGGSDVDVDLVDWARLRGLVPALRDTDPPADDPPVFDPRPPALRGEPSEVEPLERVLQGLTEPDTTEIP